MRLLHTSTYKLKSFYSKTDRPPYAILSHTWGQDELGFEAIRTDIHEKLKSPKRGLCKVKDACLQARQDDLDYLWVDTCCIDKSSSTELSEALNSMFKWYQESFKCYVFMEDVTLMKDGTMANFDTSRWFTRGWTLQELIAPHGLIFFDRRWKAMKSRHEIADRVESITGIGRDILLRRHIDLDEDYHDPAHLCPACGYNDGLRRILRNEPISRKMKWAAKRTTTREEDAAYCLMGLFDINMPLLYGEGGKAFERLQQKILLNAPDQSILTWVDKPRSVRNTETCLAPRLSAFDVENFNVCHARFAADVERGDIIATTRGLELDVIFGPCVFGSSTAWAPLELFLAVLNCTIEPDNLSRVAIFVKALHPQSSTTAYGRACHDELVILRPDSSPSILSRSYTTDGREIFDLRSQDCGKTAHRKRLGMR
ncbi:hypothetical protein FDECE_17015 [Fusarium decemcellulare]|nr:hypothetical protein FDECE_17015 [Fusarium decemcellulare]